MESFKARGNSTKKNSNSKCQEISSRTSTHLLSIPFRIAHNVQSLRQWWLNLSQHEHCACRELPTPGLIFWRNWMSKLREKKGKKSSLRSQVWMESFVICLIMCQNESFLTHLPSLLILEYRFPPFTILIEFESSSGNIAHTYTHRPP